MFKAKDVLLYFALKFEGDYDRILEAIRTKQKIDEEDYKKVVSQFNGHYFTILDDCYPERFKRIYRPPLVIFYVGDVSLLNKLEDTISVVGTRQPSEYGIKMTNTLVDELVDENFIIVSGMAKGIDAVAHERALLKGGKTIAVLGSGILYPYPKQNETLYLSICRQGLVISEYPGHKKPIKENFPERNRLVAALSQGLLVIEASYHSGTLITVGAALANGSDIFCVPSRADEESGTNRLIKEGAYLVENVNDILAILPHKQKK